MGPWWLATIQAHGHLQLFGWGGLMVLGVGFFFLPRLRGAPLTAPNLLPWILGLLGSGLAMRAVVQPAFALVSFPALGWLFGASGVLELGGASLALAVLAATGRKGPPLRQRSGLLPVLPYLATGFAALWLALAVNAVLTLQAAFDGSPVIPSVGDEVVVHLGLVGFLLPVSVAVSVRSFPLFLWLKVPSPTRVRLAYPLFLSGLTLSVVGMAADSNGTAAVGGLLEGVTLLAFPAVLQLVPPRRRPGKAPTEDPHYLRPVEWLLIPAYFWLLFAGLIAVVGSAALFGAPIPISIDAERHALGSGFVTLLILGMGTRMLPGFSGRRIASVGLIWATVALGNASALLRVIPLLAPAGGMASPALEVLSIALALSGALGMAAVACLGLNLWRTFRPADASPAAHTPGAGHR